MLESNKDSVVLLIHVIIINLNIFCEVLIVK